MKKIGRVLLVFCLSLGLVGCVEDGSNYATKYVKAILDTSYYNDHEIYEEITLTSSDENDENYELGIQNKVEEFFYYWEIEYIDDEMYEEVVTIYKELYLQAKYEVNDATEISSTEYEVIVDIYPISIVETITAEMTEYVTVLNEKYSEYDYTNMSSEEYDALYIAYDNEWSDAIISAYQEKIENITYNEVESVVVSVSVDSDNIYSVESSILTEIDSYIVAY